MSEYIFPGYYNLNSAFLLSDGSDEPIDILKLIPRFHITESLDSDSIRGTATFIDSIGLLDDLPLRGEETLILNITDALKNATLYELVIYKVSDVMVKDTNDSYMYTIHFTSKQRFEAGKHRIIESHERSTSEIAQYLFSKYYKGSKNLIAEETSGTFRCVIPNYTPMQAMHFLSQRSYSSKRPSCSFRFFESADGFYFVSDEYLIEYFIENPDEIKEFTYDESLKKSADTLIQQMQNIIGFQNSERLNTVNDLYSGAYTNNVIEIDLMRKTITDNRYNYLESKDRYITMEGRNTTGEDKHTSSFSNRYFNEENERKFLLYKDYSSVGDIPGQIRGEQYLKDITNNRIPYRHHLNNTVVYITTNGRLDLKAGDVISLRIPEFTSNKRKDIHPRLSGKYLINDCTHSFKEDVYTTEMKLLKYDWGIGE